MFIFIPAYPYTLEGQACGFSPHVMGRAHAAMRAQPNECGKKRKTVFHFVPLRPFFHAILPTFLGFLIEPSKQPYYLTIDHANKVAKILLAVLYCHSIIRYYTAFYFRAIIKCCPKVLLIN